MAPLRVIAYDISDDRRRARMEKAAKSVAVRVQDSVYEASLSDAQIEGFLQRAAPLVRPPADSLCVYTLCGNCADRVWRIGFAHPAGEDPFAA